MLGFTCKELLLKQSNFLIFSCSISLVPKLALSIVLLFNIILVQILAEFEQFLDAYK